MKTILLDTALMMGVAFAMGFLVAALIKLITEILFYMQDHSIRDAINEWRQNSQARMMRYLRIRKVSEQIQSELNFDIFDYSQSHNRKESRAGQLPEIFDYSKSPNKQEKKSKKSNDLINYYYGGI